MALESVNLFYGDVQYADEGLDEVIYKTVEYDILKKKKKIDIPQYNSLIYHFFSHDRAPETLPNEICFNLSANNKQPNLREGTILSGYSQEFNGTRSATKSSYGMMSLIKSAEQNSSVEIIDKKTGVDTSPQPEDINSKNYKQTCDKAPLNNLVSYSNLNNLLKSSENTGNDELFDKIGVGNSPLLSTGESKAIELHLAKKNIETDKQNLNLRNEPSPENTKTLSPNNGEMTYHFKQWGGGHYINISMDSTGFLLKPSDNYVDSKLESLLGKDSDGNYLFDSRQENKGNNNRSANDEQSEEEC
ncbi:hypothetical protein HVV74_22220 (plasmid) [Escherichia coli]|nr:hypothetical protein [Escherichia coli]EHX4454126.1 hypothetical protein [Escherichia coli]QMQ25104.1 hypothetical protein HVV74_22220 [Escherichia coli]